MTTAAPHVDQRALRRSLDRAADTYDDHAVLQAEVCDSLVERLAFITLSPRTVVELGCRTGRGVRARTPTRGYDMPLKAEQQIG